MAKTRMTWQFA